MDKTSEILLKEEITRLNNDVTRLDHEKHLLRAKTIRELDKKYNALCERQVLKQVNAAYERAAVHCESVDRYTINRYEKKLLKRIAWGIRALKVK